MTTDPDNPNAALCRWLIDAALPLWAGTGVDHAAGGYFEKIDLRGQPVHEARRTRVVARQIYVFATAAQRGWLDGADALVDHGLSFLFDRVLQPDGMVAAAVEPDGRVVRGGFDLYEHAFVLFALAQAHRGGRTALRARAEALLARMESGWKHPRAGFEEAAPRALPLLANPHMHLLEASLAWAEQGPGGDRWDALADEIVDLCLTRFIDPATGALQECFDGRWQPLPGGASPVEPGHQFEWAWLLLRWAARHRDAGAAAAARRLLQVGEQHGVDRTRNVAVNALDATLAVADGAAKLWPQTERIKGWQAAAQFADTAADRAQALAARDAAARGLQQYLLASPAGLWNEVLGADGRFVLQDVRASSLYHIVCAIDTVQQAGAA